MHLHLKRFAHGNDSTGGALFIDGEFECYTIEDQERIVESPMRTKVQGETAIPRGVYRVDLRAEGGFHQRYKQRYGEEFHKGMLRVRNVPEFKYILFHTGNHDDHTEGCIIVGDTIQTTDESRIPPGRTKGAYKKFYQKVRDAIQDGEDVLLHVDKLRL